MTFEVNVHVQISPPRYYVYDEVSYIWSLRFHVSLVPNLMVAYPRKCILKTLYSYYFILQCTCFTH